MLGMLTWRASFVVSSALLAASSLAKSASLSACIAQICLEQIMNYGLSCRLFGAMNLKLKRPRVSMQVLLAALVIAICCQPSST